jgi:hypothetical protein
MSLHHPRHDFTKAITVTRTSLALAAVLAASFTLLACSDNSSDAGAAGSAGSSGSSGSAGSAGSSGAAGSSGTSGASGSSGASGAAGSAGSGGNGAAGAGGSAGTGGTAGDAGSAGAAGSAGSAGAAGTPSGACTNAADTTVLSDPNTDINKTVGDCAQSGLGQEPQTLDCLKAAGLTDACTQCFDDTVHCVMDNCLSQCIAGSSSPACTDCRVTHCDPPFNACSGLMPQ